ncbi:hypothetical protein FGO68_gene6383 [Halteria grandinella]|uniref:MORN repeat protein n=1 Tax=Halteria grandinella TaxID=5974 RepID=A0A8J8NVL1_HALGN|nr:hypothetical protein FGO68_gene6383 [Halteria grandinella]
MNTQLQTIENSIQSDFQKFTKKHEEIQVEIKKANSMIIELQKDLQKSDQLTKQELDILQYKLAPRSPNLFTQEELTNLLESFNEPINDYTPELNEQGQSKLTQYISANGWRMSLDQINEKADIIRTVERIKFNGAKRDGDFNDLIEGTYYGQILNGKRDGYGIVYCTDTYNDPWLYECEWKEDTPIKGRCILIVQNKWRKLEGRIDETYLITGIGSLEDEDGTQIYGEFIQGELANKGKIKAIVVQEDGKLDIEGEFDDNDRIKGKMKGEKFEDMVFEFEGEINGDKPYSGIIKVSYNDGREIEGIIVEEIVQGKMSWPDGKIYEGRLMAYYGVYQQYGNGRLTQATGEYQEGEWDCDEEVGVHSYYSKDGVLIKTKDHDESESEEDVEKGKQRQ